MPQHLRDGSRRVKGGIGVLGQGFGDRYQGFLHRDLLVVLRSARSTAWSARSRRRWRGCWTT